MQPEGETCHETLAFVQSRSALVQDSSNGLGQVCAGDSSAVLGVWMGVLFMIMQAL